jgi:protein O-mannosyl-transferase
MNIVDRLAAVLRPGRVRTLLCALLIAAVGVGVWRQVTRYYFVWDDRSYIVAMDELRDLSNLPRFFSETFVPPERAERTIPAFRPLRNVVSALLIAATDGIPQPPLFHAVSILLHIGVSLLVFTLTLALSGGRRDASLFAGLLFCVHPLAAEPVSWAKCIDDLMATAFCLASAIILLRDPQNRRSLAASLLFFALALYAKVSAVPLAAFAALVFFSARGCSARRALFLSAPYALLAALYLAHRHLVMGRSHQVPPLSGSYGQTLFDMLSVIPVYARLILGIPPFRIDYSYLPRGLTLHSPSILAGIAIGAAFLALTALALRSRSTRPVGLGAAWFLLFLAPVSNVVPMMQFAAERFLYLPLAGLLPAAIILLTRRFARRAPRAVFLFLAVLAVAWGSAAFRQSRLWRDEITLFIEAGAVPPRTAHTEFNAIHAVMKLPYMETFFDRATPADEARPLAGKVEATLDHLQSIFPTNALLLDARGVALRLAGRPESALPLFDEAIRQFPDASGPRVNKADALLDLGRMEDARSLLDEAARLDPSFQDVAAVRSRLEHMLRTEGLSHD